MNVLDRFLLTDKVALVTGGSRGLGREMVLAFAQAGADVVIASRKIEACEAVAAEVEVETGRQALPVACHVGDWDQLDRLVERSYERFDRVDVLVNNAGMSPLYDRLTDVSRSLYDKVLDVNLAGPFRLTSNVGTRMADAGGGSIIMISSRAAVRPDPRFLMYSAAKAGLNAITVGFAKAFGPRVRVNCIMAGPFLTDISSSWESREPGAAFGHHALGRAGNPDEIVGAALYLASDASSFTTGSILAVDGGIP